MSDIIESYDHQEDTIDSNDDLVSQLDVRIQRMSGPHGFPFQIGLYLTIFLVYSNIWGSRKRLTLMR